MANPVIAEVTRGDRVESIHRGSYVVCDADGSVVMAAGDVERAIYPRSAMKLIQALPLVESGAADALAMDDKMLALACASHSSETAHLDLAATILAKAGLDETDLKCGAHWPLYSAADIVDAARHYEDPTRLHNNCSGKHAGFLCACAHQGLPTADYVAHDHPLQKEIRDALEQVTGARIVGDGHGIDGCSAPTYALPMTGLALAMARLGTGVGLQTERTKAAKRLMNACMAEPWYVAGTGRMCTKIMTAGDRRVFVKFGAEGVYLASIPELGLGLAMKCDDGSARAVEVLLSAVLGRLFPDADAIADALGAFAQQDITSFAGEKAGILRAAP